MATVSSLPRVSELVLKQNKRKDNDSLRNKTKLCLLDEYEHYESVKRSWLEVKVCLKDKTVRPTYLEEHEARRKKGDLILELKAKEVKHAKCNVAVQTLISGIPKVNVYFMQHLLYTHNKYCKECYRGMEMATEMSQKEAVAAELAENAIECVVKSPRKLFCTENGFSSQNKVFETEMTEKGLGCRTKLFHTENDLRLKDLEVSFQEEILPGPGEEDQLSDEEPCSQEDYRSHSEVIPFVDISQISPESNVTPTRKRKLLDDFNLNTCVKRMSSTPFAKSIEQRSPKKRLFANMSCFQVSPLKNRNSPKRIMSSFKSTISPRMKLTNNSPLAHCSKELSPLPSLTSPVNVLDSSFKTNATMGSPEVSNLIAESHDEYEESISSQSKSRSCFASTEVLETLVKQSVGHICKVDDCKRPVIFKKYFTGSIFCISWRCNRGENYHYSKWKATDDNFNLKLSGSLLFSGCSFSKFENLCKVLDVGGLGPTSLINKQVQKCYPSIMQYWDSEQVSMLARCSEPLVIACDARNDSPGYSSKHCSLHAICLKTQKIIGVEFADCRLTGNKSPNMEPLCFRNLLNKLQKHCVIEEVVTDGHAQIKSIMSKEFPHIKHSHDIWHVAKLLKKRLAAVSKAKGCEEIALWIDDIVNHFWWCSKMCERNANKMRILWLSHLHHIQNVHDWPLGYCQHHDIETEGRTKPWLTRKSLAFQKLQPIICDKSFLKDFDYYKNFRHTGPLESYHSLLLKYCPKRIHYPWKGYISRNILAVLDYNSSIHRSVKINKNGKPRMKRKSSRVTNKWTIVPVKTPKTHNYAKELLELTLSGEVQRNVEDMFPENPTITTKRKNIAKTPCPERTELISEREKHSKFDKPSSFDLLNQCIAKKI